jgi:hypothetical protein
MPADSIETVTPGEGGWCTLCFIVHVTGGPPPPDPVGSSTLEQRLAGIATYRTLGWPLLLHGEDVSLALRPLNAVALVIPAILGTEVTELLVQRRCSPSVLVHPALPAHRIILASDPYPVPLGWPTAVHQITATLPLPPTMTTHGPVLWLRAPEPNGQRLCREFDVFAALHTASREPPPGSSPMHF